MKLKAGVGVTDISPYKPTFLVGYPHVERISTGINDPLLASSLYLENENTGIILIALDILQIDPRTAKELRKTIAKDISIPESHVFISCSHTHSGPVTMDMIAWRDDPVVPKADPEYMDFFRDNIIRSAKMAVSNVRPVEIAWTKAYTKGIGGNRLSPDGIADPEVGILAVRDLINKKFIALSIIYSMHPTVLHEDSRLVSADFPAYARKYLCKYLGDDFVILYHTGTAGNQSPRYSVRSQTFDEAERLGNMLGKSVMLGIDMLTDNDFMDDVDLIGKIVEAELVPRKMPSLSKAEELLRQRILEYERLKKENADKSAIRTAECAVFGAEETLTLAKAQEKNELRQIISQYSPADVQILKIGDSFLVGLPGEIFVEYGLQIKAMSPYKTFIVSLVNGDLQGYIVTPEHEKLGGYEASNSLFKAESGKILVDLVLKTIPINSPIILSGR